MDAFDKFEAIDHLPRNTHICRHLTFFLSRLYAQVMTLRSRVTCSADRASKVPLAHLFLWHLVFSLCFGNLWVNAGGQMFLDRHESHLTMTFLSVKSYMDITFLTLYCPIPRE